MKTAGGFINEEMAKWKKLNWHQRRAYLWDYYRIPLIILGLAILLGVYMGAYIAGRGQTALFVVMINAGEGDASVFDRLLEGTGEASARGEVAVDSGLSLRLLDETLDNDVQTMQVLAALFGMGDMDLFSANEEVFRMYAQKDGFENLALLLPQDLQREHADQLYRYTGESGRETVGGIILRKGSPLHQSGYYTDDVIIGIANKAEHLDLAMQFIRIMLEDGIPQ